MTVSATAQDRFITLDGLRLHYREWGESDAPVLVLVHGLAVHARTWDRFAAPMSDAFRVLSLDLRGHGESQWASEYSYDLLAADLAAFLRGLGIKRCALLGHSSGAIACWLHAARHPEQVERLVLVDAGPETINPNVVGAMLRQYEGASQQSLDPEPAPRSYNFIQGEDGRWRPRWDAAGLARWMRMLTPQAPNWADGQWPLLAAITCPTLIVRGAQSPALTPESAQRMAATMPDPWLVEVPNAGHAVQVDNGEGFLQAVRPFLLEGIA